MVGNGKDMVRLLEGMAVIALKVQDRFRKLDARNINVSLHLIGRERAERVADCKELWDEKLSEQKKRARPRPRPLPVPDY
jgi:hypothetical protein